MATIKVNHVAGVSSTPEEMLAAIGKIGELHIYSYVREQVEKARAAYVTQDPATIDMLRTASMLGAPERKEPVTIIGPTGTGKELVARLLHAPRSIGVDRVRREMMCVNCSGITDTLFESIVFGHIKGSYTGAVMDNPGLLVAAGEGTAFLDEVGDLPLNQQAKLLRVLETSRVLPVGGHIEKEIKCRFVFATHRNLREMVEAGKFREDLYYRIAKVVLRTHALQDRVGDVYLIAKEICRREFWTYPGDDVIKTHLSIVTKGNVRSLANWLFRISVLAFEPAEALIDL